MHPNPIGFVPRGAPVILRPSHIAARTCLMPPVDGAVPDVSVRNDCSDVVWISFKGGSPVGPDVAGCLVVQGRSAVLLTANEATLAAAAGRPNVRNVQAGAFAGAGELTVLCHQTGGTVTVQRGTAIVAEQF